MICVKQKPLKRNSEVNSLEFLFVYTGAELNWFISMEYKKVFSKAKEGLSLLGATYNEMLDDKVFKMTASLSYYTLFSIAPLLLIVIAIAGSIFGEEAARGEIVYQIEGLVGKS